MNTPSFLFCTLVLVQTHQPVDHVIEEVHALFVGGSLVSEVHPRNAFVLPPLAELVFVVQQAELLYYIVHYQVSVDRWLVGQVLLVCFAQLAHLVDVESLVRVYFQHPHHQTPQLLAVPFRRRRKAALRYTLEELVEVQVLLVRRSERAPEGTQLVSDASHAPDIRFPIVALALENFGAHVEGCTHSRESLNGLGAELATESEIPDLEVAVVVDEDVCRLEVAMHDSLAMHVLEGARNLVNVFPDLLLLESDLLLHSPLHD
mmetsp:Transcript_35597/g.54422  ORF Transcript_35597/g.54422 Transcript_35597/m.54422 type:complete len:261 (+) Transcript_35597:1538-2320(+)